MAELKPAGFGTLVRGAFSELERKGSIFGLPKEKWYYPSAEVDLSVEFNGRKAGTPLGPAAGPHTQMAQNIVLCWLGGARVMELKTIQLKDRLKIPRPCIDATNVGYNVEWSQELSLEESLREYVAASMLVDMLKAEDVLGNGGLGTETIFDMSVGYDLEGIRSGRVREWLRGMKDATRLVEELRAELPPGFERLKEVPFRTEISGSVTLSTFHGCDSDEIEAISRFLLTEMEVDVVVKMNPTLLGQEKVDYLLHDAMGYGGMRTRRSFFDNDLRFDRALDITGRLSETARQNGRHFGVKFSNTLVVENNGDYLPGEVKYMSGAPLHVVTMNLVREFRKVAGGSIPISFSAGIDRLNFADAVSMNMTPVTVCTDLLKPGGYGRLHKYLAGLSERMSKANASAITEFIRKTAGAEDLTEAGMVNTADVVDAVTADERYSSKANSGSPKKIGSTLVLFDCVNCDKCLPVCPNFSNFTIEVEPLDTEFRILRYQDDEVLAERGGRLKIRETKQIANYADFCNECGNCDVFCPEDGGPYVEKPRFFGSVETYERFSDYDGFLVYKNGGEVMMKARAATVEYLLTQVEDNSWRFGDGVIDAVIDDSTGAIVRTTMHEACRPGHTLSLEVFHIMKTLLNGVMRKGDINFVQTASALNSRGKY